MATAIVTIACQHCGGEVQRYRSQIKAKVFCSSECHGQARRGPQVNRTCKSCGKGFTVIPSKVTDGRGVYCSQKCKGGSSWVVCDTCGERFRRAKNAIRDFGNYCSPPCFRLRHGRIPAPNGDGTATIPLTRGYFAVIDEDDLEAVSGISWQAFPHRRTVYAIGRVDGHEIALHRYLNQTPDGLVTDHINGNGLDNRRSNLRSVTDAENKLNTHFHRAKESLA